MIPIVQFDPATLTLWYDTQLLATSRSGRDIGLAIHYAIDGHDAWLKCLVRNQDNEWSRTRCASVASAVWHEKRHFLDFVTTNYGALRVRQFFEIYANLGAFLHAARENGPVLVPLERNLEPMRCELNGVSIEQSTIGELARGVAQRKQMMRDDRRPVPSRFGLLEVGGEAVFEAIAYHVQLAKTARVFGLEALATVQRDNPSRELIGLKYEWVYRILVNAKLLRAQVVEEHRFVDSQDPMLLIDDKPLIPFCYAALAGRFYGQEQTRSDSASSYLPGERFASLASHLHDARPEYAELSVEDAWVAVNEACRTLFGRTAIEETEIDFEHEEEILNRYRTHDVDSHVVGAFQEYHDLRGKLLSQLKDNPLPFLHQQHWSDDIVNRTVPFVAMAAPAGVVGEVPKGFSRLSGYLHPDTDHERSPDARWWWSAMRDEEDLGDDSDQIRFASQVHWVHLASDYAPMSKLLLDGHAMRTMVGPEIFGAKNRIEHGLGLKLVVDPLSKHPEEEVDISYWYYLTGQREFRCQITNQRIEAPNGRMLGPWQIRARPGIFDALLNSVEGEQRERMHMAIWRDWSYWLVCDEVGEIFDNAQVDSSRL